MGFPLPGTKGKLIDAALRLFSQHGYNAVSVRDIAKEVGIKDASIYSHFESKDALLEEIILHFRRQFLTSIPRVGDLDRVFQVCPPRSFFERGFQLFRQRLTDPVLAQTYFVLLQERFHDNRAAEAWRCHEETVVNYVAEAFRLLIQKGLVVDLDPMVLAGVYEYPLLHLISQYIPQVCRGEDTSVTEGQIARQRDLLLSLILKDQP